ncbi:hypothetical protein Tco_1407293 [Tanacetum coccineum]
MEMVQGALDGTYIQCLVPLEDKPRYRTRKNDIATNVLGVCSQDMQFVTLRKFFIYVLAEWEGSAADGRVLQDALARPHGLKVITWLMWDTQMDKVFSHLIEDKEMPIDPLEDDHTEDDNEPDEGTQDLEVGQEDDTITNVWTSNEWASFRDNLAQSMFGSWNAND